MKRGNARGAKGVGYRHCFGSTGNGRNPLCNGRRQPSRDGTSRMNREVQVRFCEGLGVKFPGPTRQNEKPPRWPLCQLPPAADVSLPCIADGARHQGVYSIFSPSFLVSVAHLPSSRSMLTAYSSGVLAIGSPPSAMIRFVISSDSITERSSLLSRSIMGRGVPAGADTP